jgi:TPR repeat protein
MVAAADQAFANAQGMVAKYYADRRDYARAAEYAEPAAAQGNIDGQFLMGTCILIFVSKGDSSKGSLADAMKFWRSAAEQGDAVSAQLLSETLSVGLKGKFEGFEQDYVEAVKFARMAADQGNVLAQRYFIIITTLDSVLHKISQKRCGFSGLLRSKAMRPPNSK